MRFRRGIRKTGWFPSNTFRPRISEVLVYDDFVRIVAVTENKFPDSGNVGEKAWHGLVLVYIWVLYWSNMAKSNGLVVLAGMPIIQRTVHDVAAFGSRL